MAPINEAIEEIESLEPGENGLTEKSRKNMVLRMRR
jgi:hypothetical protein